jgi:predicted ATPase
LALEAAAQLIDGYPDGVWFVDLAPLRDETLLPQAVLAALDEHAARRKSGLTLVAVTLENT